MTIVSLPPILRGKLEFGNREQIDAIKKLQHEIEEQEERTRKIKAGEIKKYTVRIEYRAYYRTEVWATDKHEAEKIAEEMAKDENMDHVEIGDIGIWETK